MRVVSTQQRHPALLALTIAMVSALVLALAPLGARTSEANTAADYAIPGGWFFTQTRGQQPAGNGFAVVDSNGVPFWTAYQQLGGVAAMGFPVSHRFTWDGAVTQVFQKGILQWRAETGVQLVSALEMLGRAGLSDWMENTYAIPQVPAGAQPDVTLLSANSAIDRAYRAVPNAEVVLGAPLAFQDFGPVQSLRTERAVIQQWLVETSFAPRNGILMPNTGDLLGAAGVLPRNAAEAQNLQFFTGPTTFGVPLATVVQPQPFVGYAPFFPFFAPTVQSQPNFFPFAYGYSWTPFAPTGFNPFVYPYYTFSPFIFSQPVVQPQPVFQPFFPGPVVQPFFPNRPFLCLGDELMTFSPTRPRTNQQFTISVTSARPHSPVSLRGPGNPRFAGVVGGGRGFVWNWVATIGNGGVYNFDFIVADGATVCTANVVTVDG